MAARKKGELLSLMARLAVASGIRIILQIDVWRKRGYIEMREVSIR